MKGTEEPIENNDSEEEVEKKYRIKCKVCKKSFTTDLDPETFKKFKCSKCGAVGKFEFKIIIKKEKKLPRDLKIDEIFRMFKIAKKKSLRDYKILNFLFYAAFRNEEMASLKKENINLNTWVIKVVLGKGGKDRYIPVIEIVPFIKEDYGEKTIYEKLTEWVSESKTGYIFEGNSALGNISDRQVRRIVKRYAQLAKIENYEEIHPHTLRHSYATYLHGVLGVPLESVQKVLGHIRIDSVPSYSPVIIRTDGLIEICSIEDLWNKIRSKMEKHDDREIKKVCSVRIFNRQQNTSRNGKIKYGNKLWTDVKAISRHNYKGKLIRINTFAGLVDASPNHSIVGFGSNRSIDASKVKIGDKISMPSYHIYGKKNVWGLKDSTDIPFIGNVELAWLYGLFVAEGTAPKNSRGMQITNWKEDVLKKAKSIFDRNFHVRSFIIGGKNPRLSVNDRRVRKFFRDRFYNSDSYKVIPKEILNSPKDIKKSFLDGYLVGDGHKPENRNWSFVSNSQTLIQGLLFLFRQISDVSYNLHIRDDNEDAFQINLNKSNNRRTDPRKVKKIRRIYYNGYLYDLETKDHTFSVGIGPIKVYNTTLIYAHMTVEKARAEIIKRMKIAEMVRTVPILLEKIAKEKNANKRIEMKVDLAIKLAMINLGITH